MDFITMWILLMCISAVKERFKFCKFMILISAHARKMTMLIQNRIALPFQVRLPIFSMMLASKG